MKKLFVIILILLLSLQGHTQSSKDTTLIATKDAIKVLQAAELSKQYKVEIEAKDKEINIKDQIINKQNSLLNIKDTRINNYKQLSSINSNSYELEKKKREIIEKDYNTYITNVDKEIKSIRKKGVGGRILTGLIGVAVGIITITLIK